MSTTNWNLHTVSFNENQFAILDLALSEYLKSETSAFTAEAERRITRLRDKCRYSSNILKNRRLSVQHMRREDANRKIERLQTHHA